MIPSDPNIVRAHGRAIRLASESSLEILGRLVYARSIGDSIGLLHELDVHLNSLAAAVQSARRELETDIPPIIDHQEEAP